MRRAFTLLELMVACLLLGMLVSVLTMLFNTSAVAWRTGTAGVAELKDVRAELGEFHDIVDDLLPGRDGGSPQYRIVSVWDENGSLRARTTETPKWRKASAVSIEEAKTGARRPLNASAGNGKAAGLFNVGVRSAGPDRIFDTDDDITTLPQEVN